MCTQKILSAAKNKDYSMFTDFKSYIIMAHLPADGKTASFTTC